MLNLDQIHIFLAVARNLHFSKAAEELYVTQPAVSATIAKLEASIGLALFHRIGRRIRLTDAGVFLQTEGHLLVEHALNLEQSLQDFNSLRRGSMVLGASFTVGNYWLPSHIVRFRSEYPAIEIQCQLANAESILANTESGQFDLGLVCGSSPVEFARIVGEERLILVVGQAHPWYGKDNVDVNELRAVDWLMREPGSGAREMLEKSLSSIGLHTDVLSVYQVLQSSEMMKAMACAGAGLAALPATMVEQEIKLGALWPITIAHHELAAAPIWMIRSPKRRNSPLLARLEQLIAGDCASS